MSFEIKSNPNQASYNLVQLPLVGSGDPLHSAKKVLARYRTSFLIADIATLTKIVIDGSNHDFVTTRATDTTAGQAGIASEINTIMTTLLGTTDGSVVVSGDATRVYITTSFSELKIEKVGVSSTYSVFIPTDAKLVGTEDADVASPVIHVSLNAAADYYKVKVKPVCGKSISALSVNWAGSTAEYNSSWPRLASYTLASGVTIVDGYICFDVLKATGDTGSTMVIAITPTGGSAITYSQTIKLLDYNGQ